MDQSFKGGGQVIAREVLVEVQNGNLSYKDAIELLNDLGISVSEGTIGRALKRLEMQH
jgi:transposase-like protein